MLIGPLAGNPFPDATPSSSQRWRRRSSLGLARPIEIEAPFAALHKADVIRRGSELGVPLELTLSCMQPTRAGTAAAAASAASAATRSSKVEGQDPTTYAVRPER